MSFYKKINELNIGENLYHFIYGKGSFDGVFTKERRDYFTVTFESFGKKIFLVEMYGKIISNDPLDILKMFFVDYKNESKLDGDIIYINPFNYSNEKERNPIARNQSIYPIFNIMFLPKNESEDLVSFNRGLFYFKDELQLDYSLLPSRLEKMFQANNYMEIALDKYSYYFFPILQKWIYADEVFSMINLNNDLARYFPNFMQQNIFNKISSPEWKKNTRYFWGKELSIHPFFYLSSNNMLPNFFLENSNEYSDEEKNKIMKYVQQLKSYQSGLEAIMESYQLKGVLLCEENRDLILDYDHEMWIFNLVNEKYKQIIEAHTKKATGRTTSFQFNDSTRIMSLDEYRDEDPLSALSYHDFPFFIRYSLKDDIGDGKYLTKYEDYEDSRNGIYLWSSKEGRNYYETKNQQKMKRYYNFSFSGKDLIEFIDDDNTSKIIMLKDKGQLFDIIETMDEYQYQIVTKKPQNMIVEGKAGTGKTAVLQTRIAYNINNKFFNPKNIVLISNSQQLIYDTKYILSEMGIRNIHSENLCSIQNFLYSILTKKIKKSTMDDWREIINPQILFSNTHHQEYLEIIKVLLDFSNDSLHQDIEKQIITYKEKILLPTYENDLRENFIKRIENNFSTKNQKDIKTILSYLENDAVFKKVIHYFEVLKQQVSLKLAKNVIDNPSMYIKGGRKSKHSKRLEDVEELSTDGLFYYLIYEIVNKDSKLRTLFAKRALGEGEKYRTNSGKEDKIASSNVEYHLFDVFEYPLRRIRKVFGDDKIKLKNLVYLYYYYEQYQLAQKEGNRIQFQDILNFYQNQYHFKSLSLFDLVNCLDNIDEIYPNNDIQVVYIDEYENIPSEVISFLMKHFPKATFELYGDPTQKIGQHQIFESQRFIKNELIINYRSSLAVLENLKAKFGIGYNKDQLPYHPKQGLVEEISIEDYIKKTPISLMTTHRIAVICKRNQLKEIKELLSQKYFETEIMNLEESENIVRRKILLCAVEMVAGLEFEDVFVFEKEMDSYEKYVAESRALENLTIIKN